MLMRHIAAYAGKNRWYMLVSGFFIVLAILVLSAVGSYTYLMLENTYDQLYEVTDKYLYITAGENPGFIEYDTVPVDLDEGYPVYKLMLM